MRTSPLASRRLAVLTLLVVFGPMGGGVAAAARVGDPFLFETATLGETGFSSDESASLKE